MANIGGGSSPAVTNGGNEKYPAALAMVTVLFFFWGFVTVLNDILVPKFKSVFDLNYTKALLIQFAFFGAYFLFSIPSAKLIDSIGYKKTIVVGLLTISCGAFLFVPAANALSYPLFLAALMILAAGITALQVAANPYVSVLGPAKSASSRLNLTQAFNSLGTTIGPAIGGLLILGAADENQDSLAKLSAEAQRAAHLQQVSTVKFPYTVIGIALVVFAILIALFKLPTIPSVERHADQGGMKGLWKYRHLILGCAAIFTYVGAEVSIGSLLINYFKQPDIGNLPEVEGAKLVSCYWGGAMIGRFIGSAMLNGLKKRYIGGLLALTVLLLAISYFGGSHGIADSGSIWTLTHIASVILYRLIQFRPIIIVCGIVFTFWLLASLLKGDVVRLKTAHLLGFCAFATSTLALASMLTTGHVAMWSIILVGLFNSIMFPSIFTLGIAKLGPRTGDGSGLLIMAIVGGAIIPVAQGAIADRFGLHHAFVLPVLCYLYIAYYALKGSEPAGVEPNAT